MIGEPELGDEVEIVRKVDDKFPDDISIGDVGEVVKYTGMDEYEYQIEFNDHTRDIFSRAEIRTISRCFECNSRKLWNDSREEYFCPWCEE